MSNACNASAVSSGVKGHPPTFLFNPEFITFCPHRGVAYLTYYDSYLEKKRLEEAGEAEAALSGKTRTQQDKEKRQQRLAKESEKALRQRLKAAEEGIAAAEARIAALEAQMGLPEVYANPDESARVAREHRQAQEDLDALYETWEALEAAVAERQG